MTFRSESMPAARIARRACMSNTTRADTIVQQNEYATIFHALRSHQALSPPPVDLDSSLLQTDNETAWSQLLVGRLVPFLVPPEDLVNPCLQVLVQELLSEMILRGAVCNKATEPWLLWDGTRKLIISPQPRPAFSRTVDHSASKGYTRSNEQRRRHVRSIISFVFWSGIQTMITVWHALLAVVGAYRNSSTIPRPSHPRRIAKTTHDANQGNGRRAILDMALWSLLAYAALLPQRMPWLSGLLNLVHWLLLRGPWKLGIVDSKIDR